MKKFPIILLALAIVAGGGFGAYMYFTRNNKDKEEVKELPSTYENLKWGSSYEEVYNNATNRDEAIMAENSQLKNTSMISTVRQNYEDVDGTVKVMYMIDKTTGLKAVSLRFEKNQCSPELKKIYKSYEKRLKKYCKQEEIKCFWSNNAGIYYELEDYDDEVKLVISKEQDK